MKYSKALGAVCLLLSTAVTTHSLADPVTLTFDELPTQPVDGLSFMGVTFHFEIGGQSSPDARYASSGPGSTKFIQDPSLEGNAAGILTLDFELPTPVVQFGFGLSTFDTLTPGFTVELFDPTLSSLGVTEVKTGPIESFSEAFFSHEGLLVSRVVIDPNEIGHQIYPGFELDVPYLGEE